MRVVLPDLGPVKQDVRVLLRSDRGQRFNPLLVRLLHLLQPRSGMTFDIDLVNQPMMRVTKKYKVREILLQERGKGWVSAWPVRFVGNDVSNVGGIEFVLGLAVAVQGLVAPFVLAATGCFPPEAKLYPIRDVTN